MISFSGQGILLDIEGTTSSIRFVYEVLFPYVVQNLSEFLENNWLKPEVQAAAEQIARDSGASSLEEWITQPPTSQGSIEERNLFKIKLEVLRLMKNDAKTTGLKELQGLIWKEGYLSGKLCSHVYDDVPPALKAWQEAGKDVRIYSSGSITAQKLFFAHTEHGDLTPYFRGHYDTTTGPKKEAASYQAIVRDMKLKPEQILFCSDIVAELDAAKKAGLQTALVVRPGNAPVAEGHGHPEITSFEQIKI